MPFTFKLSQRLARMRCGIVLLAALTLPGCELPSTNPDLADSPVARVLVSPDSVAVDSNQSYQFRAFGQTTAGDNVAVSVSWSASLGTITPGGLYTADGSTADALITATLTSSPTLSGTALVQKRRVVEIVLTPSSASVPVGGTQQFSAYGRTNTSDSVSVSVTYTATGGTITGSGLYAAGQVPGNYWVVATQDGGSLADTSTVTVSTVPGQVTYYSTNFTDGTTGPLDVYAYGGGSCAPSTDYTDPGSAYSMKCTVPAGTGAAALQAWFGRGKLAGTPKDPSLDQDLYQQVRFVLAPGAAAAVGGTSCTSQNPGSQFKTHKSVYGQVGSNVNGWVMSEIAPCTDGEIGMFSEAEMWGQNGTPYPWPGTYPSLNEGTVYDVVYRYHRYTALNCGTIAIWVNGTKVLDSACWSYMGTTGGSADGLLFWDGATYLQEGLGALTVHTLFTQATNYPIGAAAGVP